MGARWVTGGACGMVRGACWFESVLVRNSVLEAKSPVGAGVVRGFAVGSECGVDVVPVGELGCAAGRGRIVAGSAGFGGDDSESHRAEFLVAVGAFVTPDAAHDLDEAAAGTVAGFAADAPPRSGAAPGPIVLRVRDGESAGPIEADGMTGQAGGVSGVVPIHVELGGAFVLGRDGRCQGIPGSALGGVEEGFVPLPVTHATSFGTDIGGDGITIGMGQCGLLFGGGRAVFGVQFAEYEEQERHANRQCCEGQESAATSPRIKRKPAARRA